MEPDYWVGQAHPVGSLGGPGPPCWIIGRAKPTLLDHWAGQAHPVGSLGEPGPPCWIIGGPVAPLAPPVPTPLHLNTQQSIVMKAMLL